MFISPMLLNPIKEIPLVTSSSIVELKFDGIRTILSNMNNEIKIYSRHGTNITNSFPELQESKLPNGILIDGETIQAEPDGTPNFEDIMSRFHLRNRSKIKHLAVNNPVTFCVFDILYYKGNSVMSLPLLQRKEILAAALPSDTRSIVKVQYMKGANAAALFRACKERNLEGIVLKQNKSYLPGSRPKGYWDKMICYTEAMVNIIGIRKGKFGLLATYQDGRYAGVIELAIPLQTKKILYNFAQKYGKISGENVYLPECIPCDIRYRAITKKGLLRLAEFQNLVYPKEIIARLNNSRLA